VDDQLIWNVHPLDRMAQGTKSLWMGVGS
jgi:hypothetical protein